MPDQIFQTTGVAMKDSASLTAKEVSKIQFSSEAVMPLLVAAAIGGFTSAWWSLRNGKIPKLLDLISSTIVSALITVATICILSDSNLTFQRLVYLSIMCGFSGDILIRIAVKVFVTAYTRITGVDPTKPTDQ